VSPKKLIVAVRRRRALFFAILTGTLCVVAVLTALRQPVYEATTEVVLGGAEPDQEIARVRSGEMAARVSTSLRLDTVAGFTADHGPMQRLRALLGQPLPSARAVTQTEIVDRLVRDLAVRHPAETLSLVIAYRAGDADTAAQIANAYARLYTGGAAGGSASGRIISTAAAPPSPVTPRPWLNLAIGLVVGSLLGFAAAAARELRFRGLSDAGDIRDRLWLHHLGNIPELASVLPNAGSAADAVVQSPSSAYAEAFRGLLTELRSSGTAGSQVIALASALPGEGRTTVAVGLARTLALVGESVVVVDADAGDGGVSAMFGTGASVGLAEVLGGAVTLDEALVRDSASGACILVRGRDRQGAPALLSGAALRGLVEELRRRFGNVLIVTGPLATAEEARNVATVADQMAVVIRWRATPDHVVKEALKQLRGRDVHIAGAILSRVDMRRHVRFADDDASVYQRQLSKYYS